MNEPLTLPAQMFQYEMFNRGHTGAPTAAFPLWLVPLTCRGPAAEVWWWWWHHACSRPSRCFSSPWLLDPAPWCSPNARYHPRTGGRPRGPLTGWSASRCKTHLSWVKKGERVMRSRSDAESVSTVYHLSKHYLVRCWMDFFQQLCFYHHHHSWESL